MGKERQTKEVDSPRGKEDGFIPASKILSEKGERTRTRNLSDPEWEGILDQLTREVSESENEMS